MYLSVYTHPIVLSLQALSIWIICAFSMHRCRSIIRPSTLFTSFNKEDSISNYFSIKNLFWCCINNKKKLIRKKKKFSIDQTNVINDCDESSHSEDNNEKHFLCQIKLKNNFNHKTRILEFYTRSVNFFLRCRKRPLKLTLFFCEFSPLFRSEQLASVSTNFKEHTDYCSRGKCLFF